MQFRIKKFCGLISNEEKGKNIHFFVSVFARLILIHLLLLSFRALAAFFSKP